MNYRTGDVVCGCRLEEECGRGSYGVVFVGVDTIGVRRAVKLIPCGSSLAKRELTGLRNYKKCHHRNLLAIHPVELSCAASWTWRTTFVRRARRAAIFPTR